MPQQLLGTRNLLSARQGGLIALVFFLNNARTAAAVPASADDSNWLLQLSSDLLAFGTIRWLLVELEAAQAPALLLATDDASSPARSFGRCAHRFALLAPVLPSQCTCYARKDGTMDAEGNLVAAWTGPDCSLRELL